MGRNPDGGSSSGFEFQTKLKRLMRCTQINNEKKNWIQMKNKITQKRALKEPK